jgi:hypothetical protein
MGLDQDRAGQPEHGSVIGKDPDHIGSAFALLVDRANGLVLQILAQWAGGKDAKAVRS